MQGKAKIKKRFKEYSKALLQSFSAMKDHPADDSIHDFRVGVKKLRALVRLTSTGGRSETTLPKSLRKVYRQAGEVRNWELFLQTFADNAELKAFGDTKLSASRSALQDIVKKTSLKKSLKKISRKVPQKIRVGTIDIFLSGKQTAANAITVSGSMDDEQLHSLRKQLKDIQYDSHLTEKDADSKRYEKLSVQLGNFQDLRVELELLEKVQDEKHKPSIERIIHREQIKKKRLVRKLKRKLEHRRLFRMQLS